MDQAEQRLRARGDPAAFGSAQTGTGDADDNLQENFGWDTSSMKLVMSWFNYEQGLRHTSLDDAYNEDASDTQPTRLGLKDLSSSFQDCEQYGG